MRRGFLIALSTALLAAPAAVAKGQPALKLESTKPFVIHGQSFAPRERVVVRIVVRGSGDSYAHRVVASAQGSFATSFAGVQLGRCLSVSVTAAGSKGSKATYRTHQLPGCMPE